MTDSHGLSTEEAIHVSDTFEQADSDEWSRYVHRYIVFAKLQPTSPFYVQIFINVTWLLSFQCDLCEKRQIEDKYSLNRVLVTIFLRND